MTYIVRVSIISSDFIEKEQVAMSDAYQTLARSLIPFEATCRIVGEVLTFCQHLKSATIQINARKTKKEGTNGKR